MLIKHFSQKDKDQFNSFVLSHPLGNIHQTWQWGEFQKTIPGRSKFFAIGVEDESGNLRGSALVIKQDLPFGLSWLFCPRGPLVNYNSKIGEMLLSELDALAQAEKAVFLRIEGPEYSQGEKRPSIEGFEGWQKAHACYQPETTLKIDLSLSEEEILKQMKEKGRYNIRLAEKKGVEIVGVIRESPLCSIEEGIENFYNLLNETTARDNFSGHSKDFYFNMLNILSKKDWAKLYLAKYQGEIIAGTIVNFFKDEAIYYFGASGNKHREAMAPYLLQWTAIKEAKSKGMKFYDFLGISPLDAGENHPWKGVTDFKKKFGGKIINYIPAREKIYKKFWYWIIRMMKKVRAK